MSTQPTATSEACAASRSASVPPKSASSSIAKDPNAANVATVGLPMTWSPMREQRRHDDRRPRRAPGRAQAAVASEQPALQTPHDHRPSPGGGQHREGRSALSSVSRSRDERGRPPRARGWRRCVSQKRRPAFLVEVDEGVVAPGGRAPAQPVERLARTTSAMASAASTAIRSATEAVGSVACRWYPHPSCRTSWGRACPSRRSWLTTATTSSSSAPQMPASTVRRRWTSASSAASPTRLPVNCQVVEER